MAQVQILAGVLGSGDPGRVTNALLSLLSDEAGGTDISGLVGEVLQVCAKLGASSCIDAFAL
jgi:hypothetical protein